MIKYYNHPSINQSINQSINLSQSCKQFSTPILMMFPFHVPTNSFNVFWLRVMLHVRFETVPF
jgi:hypothetical protein